MDTEVNQETMEESYLQRVEKTDISNTMHFDTAKTLIRALKSGYSTETVYPLKGADISTLIMIDKFPNRLMNFYSFRLNLENGSFTYVANKLENLGLIQMVISEEDKRKKFLVLTEEGQKEVNRLKENLNYHIEKKLSVLSDEDRLQFSEAMNTIRGLTLKLLEKE